MVTAYQGTVQNGQIHFDDGLELPEGAQVIVVVVREKSLVEGMTGADILASGLVGMWADRDDIEDSAAFVEALRRQAEQRD